MKSAHHCLADKSGIISCVPYRAYVMVIIRATVAKVMQNNLERMQSAWIMGGEGRARMTEEIPLLHLCRDVQTYGCYCTFLVHLELRPAK